MWEEILKMALGNGLWAVLFCVLLLYQLRDGRVRESKYRQTIDVLLDRLGSLENVERGMEEIFAVLKRREKKRESSASITNANAGAVMNV